MVALLLTFAAIISDGVWGLRLIELSGPQYPDRGETVKLTCSFDTDGATLYSVKWYKDEYEFFRYMPNNRPQTIQFPLTGVLLDETMSGVDHITLTNVVFITSGNYCCEVSTEAPSFETVFSHHNMTVLSYPREEPLLMEEQQLVSTGDPVSVNCSAPPSYPAPQIHFYTNNYKAEEWLIERGPVNVHEDGTYSTWATLRFNAEPQHFPAPGAVLELRCEVTAAPLPPATATKRLYLTDSHQKLAQKTYRSQGTAVICNCLTLVFFLLAAFS